MNSASFDVLSRRLGAATSRRGLLKVFLAGLAGGIGLPLIRRGASETVATASTPLPPFAGGSSPVLFCAGILPAPQSAILRRASRAQARLPRKVTA